MGAKTSKIRKSAKGESCTLRLGNCSSNETVVLAHIGKDKGVGIKCADYMAVYACYSCHDIIDGRARTAFFTYDELNTEKLRALEETLGILINKGLMSIT